MLAKIILALALVAALWAFVLDEKHAVATCQTKHSASVCFQQMNR